MLSTGNSRDINRDMMKVFPSLPVITQRSTVPDAILGH